jgi:hypothetical protein
MHGRSLVAVMLRSENEVPVIRHQAVGTNAASASRGSRDDHAADVVIVVGAEAEAAIRASVTRF